MRVSQVQLFSAWAKSHKRQGLVKRSANKTYQGPATTWGLTLSRTLQAATKTIPPNGWAMWRSYATPPAVDCRHNLDLMIACQTLGQQKPPQTFHHSVFPTCVELAFGSPHPSASTDREQANPCDILFSAKWYDLETHLRTQHLL